MTLRLEGGLHIRPAPEDVKAGMEIIHLVHGRISGTFYADMVGLLGTEGGTMLFFRLGGTEMSLSAGYVVVDHMGGVFMTSFIGYRGDADLRWVGWEGLSALAEKEERK